MNAEWFIFGMIVGGLLVAAGMVFQTLVMKR